MSNCNTVYNQHGLLLRRQCLQMSLFCLHLPSTEHGGEQSWKATPKVTPKAPPWCCWPLLGVGWASHFPSEHMWQKRQRVSSETEAEASVCLALCSLSLAALSRPSWRGQLRCWKSLYWKEMSSLRTTDHRKLNLPTSTWVSLETYLSPVQPWDDCSPS